ncbi:Phospholipid:diacylglycerol acyltransferase [Phytophthora fragariae]|uniref:Phospholipid:diacylglycerol acyltransferase n=1 Tax=Phytophthora fragariae TaxID=53985 RepID=A0A6A3RJ23_9STRA|nr:Phospholipid:diacylglycerol acyltransferase [Phytophthora fragariae]KAE8933239.1 Phospholipid:diacylglycerol acyltransferase [Phytophthora fragariae]KAE8997391.1 Phospholipid:diacylglycerol acyltransferase [Phytophthora fragariae]KAE9096754.1 Phospholipid:diacylglycerol acyltransferase [Phytophthora fragariae]KAE9096924.1 Phospholipid:diacylglycerol acyltransferase [Phytophthora fragariae]
MTLDGASSASGVRQRKSHVAGPSGGPSSATADIVANAFTAAKHEDPQAKKKFQQAARSLGRTQSWHARVADHLAKKRIYSILAGVIIGVAAVIGFQSLYLEQPLISEDSLLKVREMFDNFNWSVNVREELLAAFDNRPALLGAAEKRPGLQLFQEQNVTAYSPVVLLPGFTSTGLEIWNGSDCSKAYFRQRMWGTSRMLQQFMMNQKCWLEHMMLNRTSGMDPGGIKLRAAKGLEAADYLIGGFWVWGKMVENLAEIGYDSNNLYMAAYDWRLMPHLLEVRDGYFTKLKYTIEMAKKSAGGRKVMLVTHSYATQVFFHFLKWVESENGGQGGDQWVENNVEAFVNIAGPTLGAVKTISALMSGEMKDTAELGGLSKFLGYFFSVSARTQLARSWSSVFSMLPIGGDRVWGTADSAPDDVVAASPLSTGENSTVDPKKVKEHVGRFGSTGQVVRFVNNTHENITAGGVQKLLAEIDPYLETFRASLSTGIAEDPSLPEYDQSKYWTNPLEAALPKAPSLKVFCFYGVGKPVERGYTYGENPPMEDNVVVNGKRVAPYVFNTDVDDLPYVKDGLRYSDGDGTVPLVSLGLMCASGWRTKKYNPGGVDVRVREYRHNPVSMLYDARGGPETADHVDIMGNHALIRDVLLVAARAYDRVPENITSSIMDIAGRVGEL